MAAGGAEISIETVIEGGGWPKAETLTALAESVTAELFALPCLRGSRSELSLVFTTDAAIRALNKQWRGQDKPTNVLSFPAFPLRPGQKPQAVLGDVILAWETVRAEAAAEHKPLEHHICHLLLHGCLHLLGYDHQNEAEAAEMENLETKLLARLAIDDPYAGAL